MLINDFYANREILITGGTGFLGKALIEKLLRDSPKIKVLYVLLRSKKFLSPEERLEQLKNDLVFERINKVCPEMFKKLHIIQGNTAELGLGIQPNDLKLLQNVSIVFHMAANVKFDDHLRSSILLNTRGTHELVKIAETFKNLIAFVHCSTAYCNPFEPTVEEKVYEMSVDWRQAIKIAETVDESTLNFLCQKYTGFYPNTYSFTKNLSEQLIKEYSAKLPMTIYRPSVVLNAFKEPAIGWIDNLNGPIAGMVAFSVGILPVVYFYPSIHLDMLPIDLITKLTIIAAFKRGCQSLRKESTTGGLEVINCASGQIYEIDMNAAICLYDTVARENPMENKIWDYDLPLITGCYYYFIFQIFFYAIPLLSVIDLLLRLAGRKPMALQMLRRAVYSINAVSFYCTHAYKIINKNMVDMETLIAAADKPLYGIKEDFNIGVLNYFDNLPGGIKLNLFKQPPQASAAALTRAKILFIVSRSIRFLAIFLLIIYSWSIVKKLA